jgi:hypothetical protein
LAIKDAHYAVDDVARLVPGDPNDLALVHGHIPYGAGAILGPGVTYVTWLRHPISRIISMYRYRLRKARENGVQPMTLRRFLSSGKVRDVENGQTRRLAGVDPPLGRCTPDMLALAKQHLDELHTVFGLTEYFDESLALIRRRFGWWHTFYARENSAPAAGPLRLTEDDLDVIREYNLLDLELYDYAHDRFEETLARQRIDFTLEVRAFKGLNRLYSAGRWRYKRLRRRLTGRALPIRSAVHAVVSKAEPTGLREVGQTVWRGASPEDVQQRAVVAVDDRDRAVAPRRDPDLLAVR